MPQQADVPEQPSLFDATFDDRFIDQHGGKIVKNPITAILELVSNAWDAYATRVEITWPDPDAGIPFSIRDDGEGMTAEHVRRVWNWVTYNRLINQGNTASPPPDIDGKARKVLGRNGKGRYAAFCFADSYILRTWRDGAENTYRVQRGGNPFRIRTLNDSKRRRGHGTEITAEGMPAIKIDPEQVRREIGFRFLTDPRFEVIVNGKAVKFEDIPEGRQTRQTLAVGNFGTLEVLIVEAPPDRHSRHHGVGWRVSGKLVGDADWKNVTLEGSAGDLRRSHARRYTLIVNADLLADAGAVLPDWDGFVADNEVWQAAKVAVETYISNWYLGLMRESSRARGDAIKDRYRPQVTALPRISRERWLLFVDEMTTKCPGMKEEDLDRLAGILIKLEASRHKYDILSSVEAWTGDDFDKAVETTERWDRESAMLVLDELEERLQLIGQLREKCKDKLTDEVHELQPLFERALWVFGPEYEAAAFRSNNTIRTALRTYLKVDKGSRKRPDFVVLPDGSGSVDAYSLPHYVGTVAHGLRRVVIVELKKPGFPISEKHKSQAWGYVKELESLGLISRNITAVTCYVLGERVDPQEAEPRREWNGTVEIIPLDYDSFVERAHGRTFDLYHKLKTAPFLNGGADLGTVTLFPR